MALLSAKDAGRAGLLKMRLCELRLVAIHRGALPSFTWENWAFCCGVILRQFKPGRYKFYRLRRQCPDWLMWPDLSPETILCAGLNSKNKVAFDLDEVPDAVLEAVERGIKRSRDFRGVMSARLVGKMMGLTHALRSELGLRHIAAIDADAAQAAARRREQDRRRQAAARQRAGATPRERSVAAQARAMSLKPDTLSKQLRRLEKRKTVRFSSRRLQFYNDATYQKNSEQIQFDS